MPMSPTAMPDARRSLTVAQSAEAARAFGMHCHPGKLEPRERTTSAVAMVTATLPRSSFYLAAAIFVFLLPVTAAFLALAACCT